MKPSSMQPILRSRLLPRVSFRALLAGTTVFAVLSMAARVAGDGGILAKAFLVVIAVFVFFFVLLALSFLLAWVVSRLVLGETDNRLQGNPFAEGQLPPQQLRPRERTS